MESLEKVVRQALARITESSSWAPASEGYVVSLAVSNAGRIYASGEDGGLFWALRMKWGKS